ncbi:MAG: glycosyltransferase family 4 protein [Acidobacteria bacterium]|nr:glycosyltransferase family 4 protein [Acidobacteriota bacterium]
MKIAIDIRRIQDFGIGTYIRNLVKTLAARDFENEYILFGELEKAAAAGAIPGNENFRLIHWGGHDGLRMHLELYRLLQNHAVDVLHIPHLHLAPLVPCKYVMTVHDVADFVYDSKRGFKQNIRWRLVQRAVRQAHRILAVSNATKRDLEDLLQVPSSRITVVENAIDERFIHPCPEEDKLRALERYSVDDPFLLYVGSAKPQKNVPRLIEAFAAVKSRLREHPVYRNLRLLIIGDEISEHSDLRRAVLRTRMQHEVRFLGFVPVDILRVFYQSAEVFVFPSLHEGFGLPPLEAMAQGTPVVTSNVSSLPEVVGDAAVLVNPENVFEIARAIEQVLLDPDLRAKLCAKGRRQVERFSWDRSVSKVLDIYAEAAGHASAADMASPMTTVD